MFERFTERAIRIIMAAQEEARRLRHNFVGTEHLLLGMLREKEPVIMQTIEALGINPKLVRQKTEEAAHKRGTLDIEGEVPFTSDVKKSIELAWDEARQLGHSHVGVEHLFLGLMKESSGVAARILSSFGISVAAARDKIISLLGEETEVVLPRKSAAPTNTPLLDSFSRDLTAYAKLQKLDPVVGRKKEIERVTQILSRRTKNNPVLTGDAGVGKTAIVEGLAQKIVSSDVPPPLMDRRVVTLDLGLMVAGTKYRGEFEERMKKVLEEVRKAGRIILFIDELHTLIGAGGAEGALDAANILKPALARGEIQCIGATTIEEFRKHIEEDPALERRFQSVLVNEPTVEETIDILKGLRPRYEEFHKVKIDDDALASAARLSARYISDRHLPDKAIDLMDEAASRVMLRSFATSPELEKLTLDLEKVRQEKEEAIARQDFEKASELREREDTIRAERDEELSHYREGERTMGAAVNTEEIAQVVSAWTGVPVAQMTEKETERLLRMEEELKKKVIGQDESVIA
ncbi:MAG: Clp protease N-terminal domain-containing protein, partial [bacterium]